MEWSVVLGLALSIGAGILAGRLSGSVLIGIVVGAVVYGFFALIDEIIFSNKVKKSRKVKYQRIYDAAMAGSTQTNYSGYASGTRVHRGNSINGPLACYIVGNEIHAPDGELKYYIVGNEVQTALGEVICNRDGNYVRRGGSHIGEILYNIEGNYVYFGDGTHISNNVAYYVEW